MMKSYSLLLLMLISCDAFTKDFGVIGEVFPVLEKSFLELIYERLETLKENGELQALNQRWTNTVANHTNRPKPLNLERASISKKHNYNPEVILSQAIVDNNGRILYPIGTKINALQQMPFYKPCWLFFNADDIAQLKWAEKEKKSCANPKFILTGGAIKYAEKHLQAVIYFDQEARITQKLNITHVPSKVIREENHLAIFEVVIKENGNAL